MNNVEKSALYREIKLEMNCEGNKKQSLRSYAEKFKISVPTLREIRNSTLPPEEMYLFRPSGNPSKTKVTKDQLPVYNKILSDIFEEERLWLYDELKTYIFDSLNKSLMPEDALTTGEPLKRNFIAERLIKKIGLDYSVVLRNIKKKEDGFDTYFINSIRGKESQIKIGTSKNFFCTVQQATRHPDRILLTRIGTLHDLKKAELLCFMVGTTKSCRYVILLQKNNVPLEELYYLELCEKLAPFFPKNKTTYLTVDSILSQVLREKDSIKTKFQGKTIRAIYAPKLSTAT